MRRIKFLILLITVFVILACDLGSSQIATSTKPTVTIGSPPHGAEIPQGQKILVQASATDSSGIARIELWVDGTLVTMAQPPSPQAQFNAVLHWTPNSPGSHTLMVKAINSSSTTSEPAAVVVNVTGAVAIAPTSLPTTAPTAQPTLPPAPTIQPTLAPTVPATRAPTAVPTQVPANQPSFGAITFSVTVAQPEAESRICLGVLQRLKQPEI